MKSDRTNYTRPTSNFHYERITDELQISKIDLEHSYYSFIFGRSDQIMPG